MTTTVVKSIGTAGGRDYATVALWEDDTDNTSLITTDEIRVGECYNDSEFVTTVEPSISGATTDATHYRHLKVAAGHSFRDNMTASDPLIYNVTKGVGFKTTTGYTYCLAVNENFTHVSDIQMRNVANEWGGINGNGLTYYDGLLLHMQRGYGISHQGPAPTTNCAIFMEGCNNYRAALGFNYPGAGALIDHCTVILATDYTNFIGKGISTNNSNLVVRNSACMGPFQSNGNRFQGTFNASSNYNASDDASAPGANSVLSLTYANQFEGITRATADMRVKAGSSLIGAGTPTLTVDILRRTRSATAPTLGAWEFISAGATDFNVENDPAVFTSDEEQSDDSLWFDSGNEQVNTTIAVVISQPQDIDWFDEDVTDDWWHEVGIESSRAGFVSLNVAFQGNGGVASASSESSLGNYPASNANSGSRDNAKGSGWAGTPPSGGWNDNTTSVYPDWWQADFNTAYSIGEIDVITLHDSFGSSHPSPTLLDAFTLYGIVDYLVQYWDGSAWQTVTGGNVVGNNKVWRQFIFTPVITTKIRITITASAGVNDYSRLVEVEAWTAPGGVTPDFNTDEDASLLTSDEEQSDDSFWFDSGNEQVNTFIILPSLGFRDDDPNCWTSDDEPDDWWHEVHNDRTVAIFASLGYPDDEPVVWTSQDESDDSIWFDSGNEFVPQPLASLGYKDDDPNVWNSDYEPDDWWHDIGSNDLVPWGSTPLPGKMFILRKATGGSNLRGPDVLRGLEVPLVWDGDPSLWTSDEEISDDSVWFDVGANDLVNFFVPVVPVIYQDIEWQEEDVEEELFLDENLGVQAPTPPQPYDDDPNTWTSDEEQSDDSIWMDVGSNEFVTQASAPSQPSDDDPATWVSDEEQSDDSVWFEFGNEQVTQASTPPQPYEDDSSTWVSDYEPDDSVWFEFGNEQVTQAPTPPQPYEDDSSAWVSDYEPDDSVWIDTGSNEFIVQAPTPPQPYEDDSSTWVSEYEQDDWWHEVGANELVNAFVPSIPQPQEDDPAVWTSDEEQSDDSIWFDSSSNEQAVQFNALPALGYTDDPATWTSDEEQSDDSIWIDIGANDLIPLYNRIIDPIIYLDDEAAAWVSDEEVADDQFWFDSSSNEQAVQFNALPALGYTDDPATWTSDDEPDDSVWQELGNESISFAPLIFPGLGFFDDEYNRQTSDEEVVDDQFWFESGNEQISQAPTPQQPREEDWSSLTSEDEPDDSVWYEFGNEQLTQATQPDQPRDDDPSILTSDEEQSDDSVWYEFGNEQVSQALTPDQPEDDDPSILTSDEEQSDDSLWFEHGNEQVTQAIYPPQPTEDDFSVTTSDEEQSDDSIWFESGNEQVVHFVGPRAEDPDWSVWSSDEEVTDDWWHDVGCNEQNVQAPTPQLPVSDDPATWVSDDEPDNWWYGIPEQIVGILFPSLTQPDDFSLFRGDDDYFDEHYWYEAANFTGLSYFQPPFIKRVIYRDSVNSAKIDKSSDRTVIYKNSNSAIIKRD